MDGFIFHDVADGVDDLIGLDKTSDRNLFDNIGQDLRFDGGQYGCFNITWSDGCNADILNPSGMKLASQYLRS